MGGLHVTDKRDFKTQFLLKSGRLAPLLNLSTLLNSRSKKETIPFLGYFLPGKVDDDNSSYQVFLRFNFEFGEVKPSKRKVVKTEIENIPDSTTETASVEVTTDIDFLNEIGVETIDP